KLDLAQDGDRLREDTIVAPGRYSPHSMERLLRAAINTWHGLLAAARSEEAFRQELIALVVAVTVALLGFRGSLEGPGAHRGRGFRPGGRAVEHGDRKAGRSRQPRDRSPNRPGQGHGLRRGRPCAAHRRADLAVGAGRAIWADLTRPRRDCPARARRA